MDLTRYLDLLRRHRAIVLEATFLVAVLAWAGASIRTPLYEATASVLLQPNDPAERIDTTTSVTSTDPDRYISAQLQIMRSQQVGEAAAANVPGSRASALLQQVTVAQVGATDVIRITAADPDAAQARDVANAFAAGYIENRRQHAVAGLQNAAKEIGTELKDLQTRLAILDEQIAASPGAGSGNRTPTNPVSPPTGRPTSPNPAPSAAVLGDPGGQATTTESLSAARYAAALQYTDLFARQQNLLVNITLKKGDAEIIAAASRPQTPASPKPLRDAVLGGLIGMLLGAVIALAREQLNDRLRSADEVTELIGLPVVAELPELNAQESSGLVASQAPRAPFTEAVRGLRTSVEFLGVDAPIQVLVVTSPSPAEGKSTVSANLAVVYAQRGARTLVVSADLRKPRLWDVFGYARELPGLSDLILAMNPLETATVGGPASAVSQVEALLVSTDVEGLSVLPSGSPPPNPAELLASRHGVETLLTLRSMFDIIILDTPPLVPVTDAAVLASQADGVLMVVAHGETRRGLLTRANEVLRSSHARCLGVVVNKSPVGGRGYYYASYYGDDSEQSRPRKRRWGRRRASGPVASPPVPTQPSGAHAVATSAGAAVAGKSSRWLRRASADPSPTSSTVKRPRRGSVPTGSYSAALSDSRPDGDSSA